MRDNVAQKKIAFFGIKSLLCMACLSDGGTSFLWADNTVGGTLVSHVAQTHGDQKHAGGAQADAGKLGLQGRMAPSGKSASGKPEQGIPPPPPLPTGKGPDLKDLSSEKQAAIKTMVEGIKMPVPQAAPSTSLQKAPVQESGDWIQKDGKWISPKDRQSVAAMSGHVVQDSAKQIKHSPAGKYTMHMHDDGTVKSAEYFDGVGHYSHYTKTKDASGNVRWQKVGSMSAGNMSTGGASAQVSTSDALQVTQPGKKAQTNVDDTIASGDIGAITRLKNDSNISQSDRKRLKEALLAQHPDKALQRENVHNENTSTFSKHALGMPGATGTWQETGRIDGPRVQIQANVGGDIKRRWISKDDKDKWLGKSANTGHKGYTYDAHQTSSQDKWHRHP